MAKRRSLMGSSALNAMPDRVDIGVRKIDNGYIVSHSTSDDKGYRSREVYHPEKPAVIELDAEAKKPKRPRST